MSSILTLGQSAQTFVTVISTMCEFAVPCSYACIELGKRVLGKPTPLYHMCTLVNISSSSSPVGVCTKIIHIERKVPEP